MEPGDVFPVTLNPQPKVKGLGFLNPQREVEGSTANPRVEVEGSQLDQAEAILVPVSDYLKTMELLVLVDRYVAEAERTDFGAGADNGSTELQARYAAMVSCLEELAELGAEEVGA